MKRALLILALSLTACADLGRLISDPGRVCPPGHELLRDAQGRIILDAEYLPTCVPRATPRPTATPTSEPTGAPSPTPTAIPSATPTRTPEATVPPSPTSPPPGTPVPAKVCMLDGPPWIRGAPSVPAPFTAPPCKPPLEQFAAGGKIVCAAEWMSPDGSTSRLQGLGSSIRFSHVRWTSDGYVTDDHGGPRPGCEPMRQDAYGRVVCGDELVEVGTDPDTGKPWAPFGRSGIPFDPPRCGAEAPPTPTPGAGPTPTPPGPIPTGPVADFQWGWTNVSDHPRYLKVRADGLCEWESDGAHRFKGHLRDGRFVQNTVDRDHFFCALEPCTKPADKTNQEWAEILQAHRDVYELGGGDEWITPAGITVQGENVHSVTKSGSNPYQSDIVADCGASVRIRGCLDASAYSCPDAIRNDPGNRKTWGEYDCAPVHRRPIPGAGGCGQWKAFEVR